MIKLYNFDELKPEEILNRCLGNDALKPPVVRN